MPARLTGLMWAFAADRNLARYRCPLTTGVDVSGVIDAVGSDVGGWSAGDAVTFYSLVTCGECEFCRDGAVTVCPQHKIIGEHTNGGLAEYIVVPARNLIAKPDNLTHIEVAALPVVSKTAWHMLIGVARLQAGETVFIPGAGGGVASMGIQIAKYAGATVIASTSTAEKMERARELGADHVVNYRDDNWVKQVLAFTERARSRCGAGPRRRQDLGGFAAYAGAQWTAGRMWLAFRQKLESADSPDLSSAAEHLRFQWRHIQ